MRIVVSCGHASWLHNTAINTRVVSARSLNSPSSGITQRARILANSATARIVAILRPVRCIMLAAVPRTAIHHTVFRVSFCGQVKSTGHGRPGLYASFCPASWPDYSPGAEMPGALSSLKSPDSGGMASLPRILANSARPRNNPGGPELRGISRNGHQSSRINRGPPGIMVKPTRRNRVLDTSPDGWVHWQVSSNKHLETIPSLGTLCGQRLQGAVNSRVSATFSPVYASDAMERGRGIRS